MGKRADASQLGRQQGQPGKPGLASKQAGGRRQEAGAGGRSQEPGGRRQEAGGRRQRQEAEPAA